MEGLGSSLKWNGHWSQLKQTGLLFEPAIVWGNFLYASGR
jgi:hypothetical protein